MSPFTLRKGNLLLFADPPGAGNQRSFAFLKGRLLPMESRKARFFSRELPLKKGTPLISQKILALFFKTRKTKSSWIGYRKHWPLGWRTLGFRQNGCGRNWLRWPITLASIRSEERRVGNVGRT